VTTLQDLSDAWNALRNAALGRGVRPNVPPGLAERVATDYARWRLWYRDQDPFVTLTDIRDGVTWIRLYRNLLTAVEKAGQQPERKLEPGIIEQAAEAGKEGLALVGTVALVGTAVSVLVGYLSRGKRNGSD